LKTSKRIIRVSAWLGLLALMGCAGAQVSSPLATNAGHVSSLKDLGYTELGFPEGGLQVGTLVLYDPEKPGNVTVMCADKDALVGVKFEKVAGPTEWSGARALDVGVAASFLDQAVSNAAIQSQSRDSVVLKNIRKNLMTKENIYNARLQPDCAQGIEKFFSSEDNRVLGLVYEVLRGDIESCSSVDVQTGAKADVALAAGEMHTNPSANARVLATDLVFGFKADAVAARDIAQASGVRIAVTSPQIERILSEETRPKYERLLKRDKDAGGLNGDAWDNLSFKKRLALAQDFGQIFPAAVAQADRPSEDMAQAKVAVAVPGVRP
jgi:hypothetical protein